MISAQTKEALTRAFGWAIVNRGIAFSDIERASQASNPASCLRSLRSARADLEMLLHRVKDAEELAAKDLRMDEENPNQAFLESLSFSTAPKPHLRVVGE